MNITNKKVSVTSCILDLTPTNDNTVQDCIDSIKSDFEAVLTPVREVLNDKDAYNKAKSKLPLIQWCGVFADGRRLNNLTHYNNLICLDIDHLDDPAAIKDTLKKEPCIYAIFVSPSNKGLKIIIPFADSADVDKYNGELSGDNRANAIEWLRVYHKAQFEDLKAYFKTTYNLELDKVCSDITRLCFISYDKDIFVNDHVAARPSVAIRNKVKALSTVDIPLISNKVKGSEPLIMAKDADCGSWTLEQARWHLLIVSADDYMTWRNVGFALCNAYNGSNEAFRVFCDWSKTSGKYVSDDDCKDKIWLSSQDVSCLTITLKTIAALHNAACARYYQSLFDDFGKRSNELYNLFISKADTMYLSKKRDGYKTAAKSDIKDDLTHWLMDKGVTPHTNKIDTIIRNLYMVADVYNTISCYNKGIHTFNGRHYLIEHSPKMIKPEKGDWHNLRYMLEKTLPTKDREWLYSRLALDIKGFLARDIYRKGQLLMFIGDSGTAKTTMQALIKDMFAGTSAPVAKYISGEDGFNRDMLTCPYWVVDDTFQRPIGVQIPLFREKLVDFIKTATVSSPLAFRGKYKDDVVISNMFRRAVFTLNNRNDILQLLPDCNDIEDKYCLLAYNYHFDPVGFDDGVYKTELPHFVYYLLNEWVKPSWIKDDSRFGIEAYKNPALVEAIFEASQDAAIFADIETICKAAGKDELIGKAGDIFDQLNEHIENRNLSMVMRNSSFVRVKKASFGHTLKALKKHRPEYIRNDLPLKDGYHQWQISLNPLPAGFGLN